jgi:hypothetical protein
LQQQQCSMQSAAGARLLRTCDHCILDRPQAAGQAAGVRVGLGAGAALLGGARHQRLRDLGQRGGPACGRRRRRQAVVREEADVYAARAVGLQLLHV